jgi:hypothetical protein
MSNGGVVAETTVFKKIYRALTWTTLVGLVLALILILCKSRAPDVTSDPGAAARAEQKFEMAAQARAVGQAAQVQLDRSELNSYLAKNLELKGPQPATPAAATTGAAPTQHTAGGASSTDQPTQEEVQSSVKEAKIDMEGDIIKAYVIFDFHGKDISLELDGHLRAEGGYLRFEPLGGKLGSLPLPQSALNSAVERMMTSPENREKLRLPDGINNIQIVDSHVVIDYK